MRCTSDDTPDDIHDDIPTFDLVTDARALRFGVESLDSVHAVGRRPRAGHSMTLSNMSLFVWPRCKAPKHALGFNSRYVNQSMSSVIDSTVDSVSIRRGTSMQLP